MTFVLLFPMRNTSPITAASWIIRKVASFCQTFRPLRQCLHCGGPDNCTKVKCAVAAKIDEPAYFLEATCYITWFSHCIMHPPLG